MAEFKTLDPAAYAAALDRGRDRVAPRATSARYDRGDGRIVIRLDSGLELAFPPGEAQGLERPGAKDLGRVEVAGAGSGLHFPSPDVDFSIAGLLGGRLGSEAWMAARQSARVA